MNQFDGSSSFGSWNSRQPVTLVYHSYYFPLFPPPYYLISDSLLLYPLISMLLLLFRIRIPELVFLKFSILMQDYVGTLFKYSIKQLSILLIHVHVLSLNPHQSRNPQKLPILNLLLL